MTAQEERAARRAELELAAVALGTDNQRERFAAGLLPEDELLALARAELFKPFNHLPRWGKDTKVMPGEIRHRRNCEERNDRTSPEPIVFETAQAAELSHQEWVAYREVQKARDLAAHHPWLDSAAVLIEPLMHFATCTVCQGEASRASAKITIHWAGRDLVREYVLR